MYKKITVISLSAAMFLLAQSGVSAWKGWKCCGHKDYTRNSAEIKQRVEGVANTGMNYQVNTASLNNSMGGWVEAGGEDPDMDTGDAFTTIDARVKANTNKDYDRGKWSKASKTYNWAKVDQNVFGSANTGSNEQVNQATMKKSAMGYAGAGVGSEMYMDTGDARVNIGAVTKVNYNYR